MTSAGAPRPLSSPVMVERDDDLRRLVALALRPPGIAVVEGPPGVGKSRLVAELAGHAEIDGRRVLVGRCHPLGEPFLLGPLVDALRGLKQLPPDVTFTPIVGALRPLLPELAAVLPADPIAYAEIELHVVFRAMAEFLGKLGPTLCILEDLHWSDKGTAEFVHFLVEELPADLTLVLTFRREDRARSSPPLGVPSRLPSRVATVRLELKPLTATGVRHLMAAILGVEDVSAELAETVHSRTAGLPFAIEEVVRLGQDKGLLGNPWDPRSLLALDVPAAVRDSVLDRVCALSPDGRRVVDAAAVLGLPAGEAMLAGISGLSAPRAEAALAEALRAAVLLEAEPHVYSFRHLLAAQSVYEAVPGPERRRLHLASARALERLDLKPVAPLAHHFRAGGRSDRWLEYAEAAADVAASRGDAAGAVRLLHEALSTAGLDERLRGHLAAKLGQAALRCGVEGQREAMSLLRHVLDDVGITDRSTRGRVRLLLGDLLAWEGDADGSYEEIVRSVSELESEPAYPST
ncbi:MAG: AAA family ATPase [Actinobacteria bacterium]|nr:AAA family ATPase [Actinomycetota bacterium]